MDIILRIIDENESVTLGLWLCLLYWSSEKQIWHFLVILGCVLTIFCQFGLKGSSKNITDFKIKNACNGDTNGSSPGDNFFTTHCNGYGWVADNAREWPGRSGRTVDRELNCTFQSKTFSRKRTKIVVRKQAINSWKRLYGMNLTKMRILIWIHLTNKKARRLKAIFLSI